MNSDGAKKLIEELSSRALEATDPSVDGLTPELVLEPEDEDACIRALKLCHSEDVAIIPVGGGTRITLGNVPLRCDAYLDTKRMNGVEEHIPGDLTVAVRAGTTILELQEKLKKSKQFLPLDPPLPATATIGGVLATGEPGLRRRPGSRPRDLLLGFEAVLADGTKVRAGGRVVKNVAGYELMKLFVGSLGTLGVITRAFLRLRAIPEKVVTIVCDFENLADASDAWQEIQNLPMAPEVAVLVNSVTSKLFGLNGWNLLLRFEGITEQVQGGIKDVQAHYSSDLMPDFSWEALQNFPINNGYFVIRAHVAPGQTFKLVEEWKDGNAILAYPDSGVVYNRVPSFDALALCKDRAELQEAAVVLERIPTDLKMKMDVFGKTPPSFTLMKQIKQKLDPKGILSPGRFVGRL